MKITRRNFLKSGAAAAGALAVLGPRALTIGRAAPGGGAAYKTRARGAVVRAQGPDTVLVKAQCPEPALDIKPKASKSTPQKTAKRKD